MVARNSSKGLPPGWTVNCKVLNSGRRLKYYTDLKSGKKFYSMNEVIRYMKSLNGRNFKIQQLRSCNGQRKPSMVAQNTPEELMAGWTVNCKVLNSGRKLKYYTELKTGKKFYSMNEVSRYIKSKNGKSFTTQTSIRKSSKGSMKEHLHANKKTPLDSGWLPQGWLMELRQYEAGLKIGKKYKVYINKSTGHKCYSRLEVLRWLNKQNDKAHMVKEIKKAMITRSSSYESKNNSKTKMEEHLEVVECDAHTPNYKKLRRSARNVSSLNTSPAKAHKLATEGTHLKKSADKETYFLTMSDGHVNGVQTRGSKRRQQSDLEHETTSTFTAIVLKDDHNSSGISEMRRTSKNRGSLRSRFSKRLARLEPEVATYAYAISTDCAQAPPAKWSDSDKGQNAFSLPMIEKMNAEGKGYQSLSVTKNDPYLKKENIVSTKKNMNDSTKNIKNNRDGRLCLRFSKRLAGFEPEVVPIQDSSEKVVRGVGKKLCTYQGKFISSSALSGVVHNLHQQHSGHTEEPDLNRYLLNKSTSENGIDFHQSHDLGCNAGNTRRKTKHKKNSDETKRLVGAEVEAVSNSVREGKSSLPTTSHDIPSENVEEGADNEDRETQQQSPPIWHSWSDPCLEFAFKTLTDEISIEDDLQIQSYFQQIKKPVEKDDPPMDTPRKSSEAASDRPELWINFQPGQSGPAKIETGNGK